MAIDPLNNSDNTPDSLQAAGDKINNNFTDLYNGKQPYNERLQLLSQLYADSPELFVEGMMLQAGAGGNYWIPTESEITRPFILGLGEYTQSLSSGLSELSALAPQDLDMVQNLSDVWTNITPLQLRRTLGPAQTNRIEMFEDFLYVSIPNSVFSTSTYKWIGSLGDFSVVPGAYGAYGIGVGITTGPLNNNFLIDCSQDNVVFSGLNTPGLYLTLPNILTKFRVSRANQSPTGSNYYYGYFHSSTLATSYGAYFKVTDSGNIQCITTDVNGTTTTSSGVGLPYSTWMTLGMSTDAAGTSISFYVNNVLKATHTTNIYAGTTKFAIGRNYTGVFGVSGSTTIDYWYLSVTGLNRI